MADVVLVIIGTEDRLLSGQTLIDEKRLESCGMIKFEQYKYDFQQMNWCEIGI